MEDRKIYLLAELTIRPGRLDEVKAILKAAHEFHLEQDYTKRLLASLEGKLSGVPTMTRLSAL